MRRQTEILVFTRFEKIEMTLDAFCFVIVETCCRMFSYTTLHTHRILLNLKLLNQNVYSFCYTRLLDDIWGFVPPFQDKKY